MPASRRFAFILMALAAAPGVRARLVVEPPADGPHRRFYEQLQKALDSLATSDLPEVRQLHEAVSKAPATIRFRPITNDRSTWASDGDRNRGHTQPDDARPKREGRTKPSDATIFIPTDTATPGTSRWTSGLLVHELVHAMDLATGRYHRDYHVRERRAVFLQNIWRQHLGRALRISYHGDFDTLDYQHAKRRGTMATYTRHLFTRGDFPPAP